MVVILQSAAEIFRLEYRRFVRTRRYWALTLAALLLSATLALVLTLLTYGEPRTAVGLLGVSYMGAFVLGLLALLPMIVSAPLTTRMLSDRYKTRMLPDLYLTELHPLGVVLGRVGAISALTGLSLLMLTPVALWSCLVLGIPGWLWFVMALLVMGAYLLATTSDSHAMRGIHAPDEAPLGDTRAAIPQAFTVLLALAAIAMGFLVMLFPAGQSLFTLPLWVLAPLLIPLWLLQVYPQPSTAWLLGAIGVGFQIGFAVWFAVAAAQWREWWSDAVYRGMRWGGTALWLVFVGVHTSLLADAFATDLRATERLFLLLLCLTTLLNLGIASLAGYFALARQPKPTRFALPYPLSALVWQWALQWLSAGVIYVSLGGASGQWIAFDKWLLWSLYVWIGGVVLPQAMTSDEWGYLARCPNPLRGDYHYDFFINTRRTRVYYETRGQLVAYSAVKLTAGLAILFLGAVLVNILNSMLFRLPALTALAGWLPRIHPWWGIWFEWHGMDRAWGYLAYSLAWVGLLSALRVRRGWRAAAHLEQQFAEWQRAKNEKQPVLSHPSG